MMSNSSLHIDMAGPAVFCVCCDTQMQSAIMAVCSTIPGTIFVGAFQEYFTDNRRPQFSPLLKTTTSCVAIVEFDHNPELALQTVSKLKQIFPRRINIIALGAQLDNGLVLQAMRAGCSEYLTLPVDSRELTASLIRFQHETLAASQTVTSAGRIAVCLGAKGGVGVTTLAVHLAMQLVKQHGKKTLLIDHKHELGHVALYLGLQDSQYHFDDLIRNAERLDRDLLNGFVVNHSSGLGVIASPDMCAPEHRSTRDQLQRVLSFLRHEYDYVIIDSSVAYGGLTQCLVEEADDICMVSTPDVAALRDLTRHLEHLSLSDDARGKVKIIINRSMRDDDLSAQQVETAVGSPVAIVIPDNYKELMRAINHGDPLSLQRRSSFTRKIARWASDLLKGGVGLEVAEPKKKGFVFWR